jgi:site-specific recombinase XerD
MLMLMYTTGVRVSELIGIKVKDLSLSTPCTLLDNMK